MKYIPKTFILVSILLLFSGCVNITVNQKINDDASSYITITYDFTTLMNLYNDTSIEKALDDYCKYYHSEIISGYNCEHTTRNIIKIGGYIPKMQGYENGNYDTKYLIQILNETFPPFTLYNKYHIPDFKSAMERLHANNALMIYRIKTPYSDIKLDIYDVYKNRIIVKKRNRIIRRDNDFIYIMLLMLSIITILVILVLKREDIISIVKKSKKRKASADSQVLVLIGWIQKHKKHYSKSHLRKELMKQGFRRKDIDEAFEHVD